MPIGIVIQNVLVPLGFLAFVVVIIWLNHEARRRAQERRADLIRQMMDKFPSGEAFAQAFQGPGGSKLMEAFELQDDSPARAKKGWIGLFIPASILSALSLGFLVLHLVSEQDFLRPAVIIGSVGGALALSTYAMWRVDKANLEKAHERAEDHPGVDGSLEMD